MAALRSLHELSPGQHVCGEFVLVGAAARELRAAVFSAQRPGHARERFVVRAAPFTDLGVAARIRPTLTRAQGVTHAALAPIVGFELRARTVMLVQRSIAPFSLRARLRRGPLPPHTVAWLVAELAGALDTLHDPHLGMIHGALCPANIALDDQDTAVALEGAGLVEALHDGTGPSALTDALREPGYTSPDEAVGRFTARGDAFVLACIAFECLTGARPFAGDDDAAVHASLLSDAPALASALRPSLDAAVDAVFARAFELERERPWTTCAGFAEALTDALARGASERPTWNPTPSLELPPLAAPSVPVFDPPEEIPDAPRPDLAQQTLSFGEPAVLPIVHLEPDPIPAAEPLDTLAFGEDLELDPNAALPAVVPPKVSQPFGHLTPAPPSRYRAWAGVASRPETPVAPLPESEEAAVDVTAPVFPAAPRVPILGPTPVVGTPIPPTLKLAPPRRPSPRRVRPRRARTVKVARPYFRAAIVLGAALVTAALIVTAGQIYLARHRAAARPASVATVSEPPARVQPRAAPVQPPVAAPAPPPAPTPAPTSTATVAPPDVPTTDDAPEADAATPPNGPRPARGAVIAARNQLAPLVDACTGTAFPNRRVRINVTYNAATGAPTVIRVRGYFGLSSAAQCLTNAARGITLPPFGEGTWEAGYNFATRSP
jgi:serine/threonine protein kinase